MEPFTKSDLQGRTSELNQAEHLYQSGDMSIGQAAKLAGMSLVAFTEHVSRLGIAAVDYDLEELDVELDYFKT